VPDANEVQIVKGDRKSIGVLNSKITNFSEQEIHLPQGSILYAGSDGIQDQNNAERKKFGSQRLIQLLNQMATQPIATQKQLLEERIERHMKGTTQRDDMLWIGIRV